MNPTPPPQAYTADIIARAYEWVKSQPQHIQEMAKSSDALVALYMKSRKATGSSGAFASDLKNLSEKIRKFDDFSEIEKRVEFRVESALRESPPSPGLGPAPADAKPTEQRGLDSRLTDARTQEALLQVQQALNLSSPEEALRVLVQLGLRQIRQIL